MITIASFFLLPDKARMVTFVVYIVIGVVCFLAGFVWGRCTQTHQLTSGADSQDRPAHKLNGRYYYVVPELDYAFLMSRPDRG